jgi:hypothetical protein
VAGLNPPPRRAIAAFFHAEHCHQLGQLAKRRRLAAPGDRQAASANRHIPDGMILQN